MVSDEEIKRHGFGNLIIIAKKMNKINSSKKGYHTNWKAQEIIEMLSECQRVGETTTGGFTFKETNEGYIIKYKGYFRILNRLKNLEVESDGE